MMRQKNMDAASGDDRILLLTNSMDSIPTGGRALLSRLNYELLKDIYGDRLLVSEVPRVSSRGLTSILDAFSGHIDGLNDASIDHALQILSKGGVDKLFVDGSGFGSFVKMAKTEFPQIKITTFFHNVEAIFFLGSLRSAKTLRALAVLLVNYLSERKAVLYSDNMICLSSRDSALLNKVYGRAATHVSSMAMRNVAGDNQPNRHWNRSESYALFVGGAFYANRDGIEWFIENVVPHINIKTCIIGRGWDDLKHQSQHNEKVTLVGEVDDLEPWYRNAQFIVAPIFDGSGMKTKVAEALMFGKRIIGTPEAFSGYQDVVEYAGWECTTAEEFVTAIGIAQTDIVDSFDPSLRALYDDRYSFQAARTRLENILNE